MEEQSALKSIRAKAEEVKTSRALHEIMRRREGFFNEIECSEEELRKKYFTDFPEAHLRLLKPWGVVLEAPELKRVPTPPPGYAYKGGAARIALTHALGLEVSSRAARDFDLIRVAAGPDKIDTAVAKKIMKEDAKHGQGVECIPDYETYLATRDLTINEALYCGATVVASHRAAQDTSSGIIRVTEHVLSQSEESRNRVNAKMIRFLAERIIAGQKRTLLELPSEERLFLFSFLLHLERALESKGRLAETYCREVFKHQIMPEELNGAKDLQSVTTKLRSLPAKSVKSFPNVKNLLKPPKKKTRLGKIKARK